MKNTDTEALRCLDVLRGFGITDVEVEIRESSVIRSAGPKLLAPVLPKEPTAIARKPLTHALGLSISAEATPHVAGTGGFFMAEGGESKELFLITARHVVLPEKEMHVKFEQKNVSQPRSNILLLGEEAYRSCLMSIKDKIQIQQQAVGFWKQRIEGFKGREDEQAREQRDVAEGELKPVKDAVKALCALYEDVDKHWATNDNRIIGARNLFPSHLPRCPRRRAHGGLCCHQSRQEQD